MLMMNYKKTAGVTEFRDENGPEKQSCIPSHRVQIRTFFERIIVIILEQSDLC